MKTIIKGAIYTNGEVLLRPHYSGQFHIVDCTEYKTKEQIKEEYSKDIVKQFTGKDAIYLTCDGVKYYECEYSPYCVDDDLELLSDIGDLEFFDNETEF